MTQDVFQDDKSIIRECFIKLKTPDGKIIHQKAYMKILDKLGLMIDFDLMILEQNITKCANSVDKIFAINISPTSLRNPIFIFKAKELIRENSDIKNRILFLLSEVEYYSHIDRYNNILKSFRDLGVLIAIDRLGAIHTSFLYLRDLDIDIVRFDSFYTKDMLNEKNRSIIYGFNMMAHEKGLKTWVKMVESNDIKKEVEKLKIDYIQGRYLAPIKERVSF